MRVGVVRFVPGDVSDPGHSGWNPIPFFLRHDPEKARRPSGDFRDLAANRTGDARDPGLFTSRIIEQQYEVQSTTVMNFN